jgi:2OG-Fe(II) oxygenase superfamily
MLLSIRYGKIFDSIGANFYRDGRDSVAWHRDRLGVSGDAAVSIVSTGAPRPFLLRRRGGGASRAFLVGHGDLLTMGGLANEGWEHSVPKVAHARPRISLVFRHDSDGPRGDVTSDHPSRARSSRDRHAAAKAQREAERRVWESVSSTTT